jgi:hypothetical protein
MSLDGQLPGVHSSAYDALLNPQYCGSLYERVLAGATRQVLAAPPPGKVWALLNSYVAGQVGNTSFSLTEEVPGEAVRVQDARTIGFTLTAPQFGGLFARGPLVLQNSGANAMLLCGTVVALPAAVAVPFWLQLTNAFQALVAPVPENSALRFPYGGMFQTSASSPAWCMNTDATVRAIEVRFTRGGITTTLATGLTQAALSRTAVGFCTNFWPALLPGDLVEARLTTVPVAPVYFGGLLQAVPLLGLT